MPKVLRSFIAEVESKHPEEIARVTKTISPRYEITALLTQLEKAKRFPLLYCEKVEGSDAIDIFRANQEVADPVKKNILDDNPRTLYGL